MNRIVDTLALKESRKSIQQSTSTKRLSELAYVFLPLILSTSIFGMNVIEVQNIQLRVFYGTAGIALAMSLFLWLSSGWLFEPAVVASVISIGKAIVILFNFFWQALSHAVILILFALCHSKMNTKPILIQTGLWHIICSETAPRPNFISPSSVIGQKNNWSKFWYDRVAGVEESVKSSQWRQRYLSWRKDDWINRDLGS